MGADIAELARAVARRRQRFSAGDHDRSDRHFPALGGGRRLLEGQRHEAPVTPAHLASVPRLC